MSARPMDLPTTPDEARAIRDRVFGDVREQYGYPREGPPLTMAEQKEGEWRNCLALTREVLNAHRGRRDLDTYTAFYTRATSTRDAPHFVASCVRAECFTAEGAVAATAWAWSAPEWPEANFGAPLWLDLFAAVGYFHDGADDDQGRPDAVPALWRGAIPSRRKGLAWTSDRARAEWFANRWEPGGPFKQARLWHLPAGVVHPRRVLARFDGRGESEWVIDTRRLTPVTVTDAPEGGTA